MCCGLCTGRLVQCFLGNGYTPPAKQPAIQTTRRPNTHPVARPTEHNTRKLPPIHLPAHPTNHPPTQQSIECQFDSDDVVCRMHACFARWDALFRKVVIISTCLHHFHVPFPGGMRCFGSSTALPRPAARCKRSMPCRKSSARPSIRPNQVSKSTLFAFSQTELGKHAYLSSV